MTHTTESPLQQHPLSAAWPSMPSAEFSALIEDIKAHGQHDVGVIYEGQVLDGWHRYRACAAIGIEFKAVEFDGDDPRAFVISKNGRRRHVSASVLAISAAACMEWRPHGGDQDAPGHLAPTIKQAADAVGVGKRTMARAKAAVQVGLAEEVKTGAVSLKEAEQVAKLPKAKREQAVEAIKAGEEPALPKPKVIVAERKFEKLYEEVKAELVELKETCRAQREALAELSDTDKTIQAFKDDNAVHEMEALRLELRQVKRRRDELMRENAELKKMVAHWKKKAEKQ